MISLRILALLSFVSVAIGQSQSYGLSYLADQLDRYCRVTGSASTTTIGAEVRVGKAGPRGPPGPRGIVDYDEINRNIEAKLVGLSRMAERLQELENFANTVKQGKCQVIYNGGCFWFTGGRINYARAKEICRQAGGTPANVYSEDHYRMLIKYVRGLRNGLTEPWLGMVYHQPAASYYNGTRVQWAIHWHPTFPKNDGSRTQLNLSLRQDAGHANQGIWNMAPSSVEDGVICEISFSG